MSKDKDEKWAFVCQVIQSRSGLKSPRLEQILQIGVGGSGRTWRSWLAGERVPTKRTQENVMKAARAKGWLDNLQDRQIKDLAGGTTSAEIAMLAQPDSRLRSLPYPLEEEETRSARGAAFLLMKDALAADRQTGDGWRRGRDNPEWREAVEVVREMLETAPEEVVQAKIIAAYQLRQTVTQQS